MSAKVAISGKLCYHWNLTANYWQLNYIVMANSSKSRVVAAILAIFLGGLGIHKFYMGKVGQGILYLVFSWTVIPAIVGFIEGIIFLCDSDIGFAKRCKA